MAMDFFFIVLIAKATYNKDIHSARMSKSRPKISLI